MNQTNIQEKATGENTTKIHVFIDGMKNPVYFQLSKKYINNGVLAIDVLSHVNLEDSNILG